MSIVTKATRAIGVRRGAIGVVAALAILATVSVRTQAPENVVRARHAQVTVITSPDGLVTGLAGNLNTVTGIADFVFCMSYDKPLPKPIKWTGPGTVIYGAAGKIPGLEHGPEQLGPGSGVTVLPDEGSGWLFEPGHQGTAAPGGSGEGGERDAYRDTSDPDGPGAAGVALLLRQRARRRLAPSKLRLR